MVRVFNPQLEEYLTRVMVTLYGEDEVLRRNIRIALVSAPEPGASVMEDGLLVWYIGTFDYLNSEDEVAAILAHEMAHLTAGHHSTSNAQVFTDTLMAAGETAAIFSGAGSTVELWAAAKSARWASDSVLFPSFTSEQETEADVMAARTLVDSGYNADAVRVMLGSLRSYFGDQKEFHSKQMMHLTSSKTADNGTRINLNIDPDAIIGNLKGYAENRWGQAYESFTDRESAVRTVLLEEYPQRDRGQFLGSSYKDVLNSPNVNEWLASHKVGFKLMAMELREEKDLKIFNKYVETLRKDTHTSPVFDYEAIMNAALKNNQDALVTSMASLLINADQAVFDHYLKYAGHQRQQGNFKEALAAYSAADEIFSSSVDRIIVPLILATKDDAGIKQGSTALRCLNPTLTAACLFRE